MVLSIIKSGLLRNIVRILKLKNKFSRDKENNAIVQHAVDEIILQENNIFSAEDEALENIDL